MFHSFLSLSFYLRPSSSFCICAPSNVQFTIYSGLLLFCSALVLQHRGFRVPSLFDRDRIFLAGTGTPFFTADLSLPSVILHQYYKRIGKLSNFLPLFLLTSNPVLRPFTGPSSSKMYSHGAKSIFRLLRVFCPSGVVSPSTRTFSAPVNQ